MFGRNLSTSSLPQQLLTEFIRRNYRGVHLPILRDRLSQATAQLSKIVRLHFPEGTSYRPPTAGFVHWIELPARVDMEEVHRRAAQAGIALAKSEIFSARNAYSHCLRFCMASDTESRVIGAAQQIGIFAQQALL